MKLLKPVALSSSASIVIPALILRSCKISRMWESSSSPVNASFSLNSEDNVTFICNKYETLLLLLIISVSIVTLVRDKRKEFLEND